MNPRLLSAISRLRTTTDAALRSASGDAQRPLLAKHNESSVEGLFLIGDLAGTPVIKIAMEQAVRVIDHIASLSDAKGAGPTRASLQRLCRSCFRDSPPGSQACEHCRTPLPLRDMPEVLDVLIVGAGAAGLTAALQCKERGLSCLVVEKGRIGETIESFPEGKWIYAEPTDRPAKGRLWFDGAPKEDLLARWRQAVADEGIAVEVNQTLTGVHKMAGAFKVVTLIGAEGPEVAYKARRVVIATGRRGHHRLLGIEGESQQRVYHHLYSPRQYVGEDILVVGGGNSAVEAAFVLCERNRVTLSYRGDQFARIFAENRHKVDAAIRDGKIKVLWNSTVSRFDEDSAVLNVVRPGEAGEAEEVVQHFDHAFVLIGAELPTAFLKSLGVRLENEWQGKPGLALGLTAMAFVLLWLLAAFGLRDCAASVRLPLGLGALLGPAIGLAWRGRFRADRYAWLGLSFIVCMTVYGIAKSLEPYKALFGVDPGGTIGFTFFGSFRSGAFLYTVAYCVVMTVFGAIAMKRWGFDHKDKSQIARYCCLIGCQWVFFFIVPELGYRCIVRGTPSDGSTYLAVKETIQGPTARYAFRQGAQACEGGLPGIVRMLYPEKNDTDVTAEAERLASGFEQEGTLAMDAVPPQIVMAALVVDWGWDGPRARQAEKLAEQSGRAYGLLYAWPLSTGTFYGNPPLFWAIWGVLLSFVVLPIFVLFHGKRYCSWICGCGGLAETLGDRWRHLAPKGPAALRHERVGGWLLGLAVAVLLITLSIDTWKLISLPTWAAERARAWHSLLLDVWAAGILPVTLYPFLGGKVWCRFWCPLAKMMELTSRLFTKLGVSRFRIDADDRCIACGECTRYCQVGIPVMQYALKRQTLDNATSSCIGCGICVTVCPMDTLSLGGKANKPRGESVVARATEG